MSKQADYKMLTTSARGQPAELCTNCSPLFRAHDINAVDEDGILKVPFSITDSLPQCPIMTWSASQGCGFCAILMKSLLKASYLYDEPSEVILGPWAYFSAQRSGHIDGDKGDEGFYLLGIDVTTPWDSESMRWKLFAEEGSIAATELQIILRPPVPDRTSPTCGRQLRSWIEKCTSTHESCRVRAKAQFPARVLDIGKLAEDGTVLPRIVMTSDDIRNEKYATLSHRWGPEAVTIRIVKTLSSNFHDMTVGTALQSLPQNFKDAIIIAQLLGIRYLWIDSLCIIQDDTQDWETEGSKMGQIYENAYVTIVATSAETAEDGFLDCQSVFQLTPVALGKDTKDTTPNRVLLQELSSSAMMDVGSEVAWTTWNGRAWTLQERVLSKRILHFCKRQIYWECRKMLISETGQREYSPYSNHEPDHQSDHQSDYGSDPESDPEPEQESGNTERKLGSSTIHEGVSSPESLYRWWRETIHMYSMRRLTYASDRLPAISGLAGALASKLAKLGIEDTYTAGFWSGNLAQCLLWSTSSPKYNGDGPQPPSWSWTLCEGQACYESHDLENDRTRASVIRLVSYEIELMGVNPYGQVATASLTLESRRCAVTTPQSAGTTHDRSVRPCIPINFAMTGRTAMTIGRGRLDFVRGPDLDKCQPLYCLQIKHQVPQTNEYDVSWSGILIGPINAEMTEFRRVGIYLLEQEHINFFDDVEP